MELDATVDTANDLKSFVTYRLARLQSSLNAQAIRLLKQHSDLSLTEWRIVAVCALNETCTLSDLVRDTTLDKGQLSRAVARLVEKRYIASKVNQHDQRQNLLHLTVEGRNLHDRVLPVMRLRQQHLVARVEQDDLTTALRVIDALSEAAATLPEQ